MQTEAKTAELVIEKGVPIPPRGRGRGPAAGTLVATLRSMDVGDSVFVAGAKQSSVGANCFDVRNHPDHREKRFATRKTDDGVRVWRTA